MDIVKKIAAELEIRPQQVMQSKYIATGGQTGQSSDGL